MTRLRFPKGDRGQHTVGINTDHIETYETFGATDGEGNPKEGTTITVTMLSGDVRKYGGDQALALMAVLRGEFRPVELRKVE